MSKLERRLCVAAAVFVFIYLMAIGISIRSRISAPEKETKLENVGPTKKERGFILAELFLPMLIVGTVTASLIVVRRKQAKRKWMSEDEEEDILDDCFEAEGDMNLPEEYENETKEVEPS